MTTEEDIERIIAEARALPPMTEEKKLQRLDFAYGNLACSTNHKPRYGAFKEVARTMGISRERFDEWALDKDWVYE